MSLTAVRAADPSRTLLLPDWRYYVGDFNADLKPDGQGKMHHPGDRTASGQWRDGKQHGIGTLHFPGGGSYEGNFKDDKYSGLGKWTCADRRVYEGGFRDGQFDGHGIRWNNDGSMQCGEWRNGSFRGSGPVPRAELPPGTIRNAAVQPPAHSPSPFVRVSLTACHQLDVAVASLLTSIRSPLFRFGALSAVPTANDATLIYPDGRFYRGEINDQFQRHGRGSIHTADGERLESGTWGNDKWIEPQTLHVVGRQRCALLIGIDDGAKSMRVALDQLGFRCTLLDATRTRSQMTDGIRNFIATLQANDTVFFLLQRPRSGVARRHLSAAGRLRLWLPLVE